MAAADSPSASGIYLLHQARSFSALPGRDGTGPLLAELATAPCPFSAALADRPLALYGAGNLGRMARDFLRNVGHDFVLAVDRNAETLASDAGWAGVEMLHPDNVTESAKTGVRLAVSIVSSPYVPIERSLRAIGFGDVVPFYDLTESFRHLHPLSNGWFAPTLTGDEIANTAAVLARWDDDVSRAHHLQFLAWRRLRQEWSFAPAPVTSGDRFFIPEVTALMHDRESLVDAGGHHGSVIEAFLARTHGRFRQIAAFEPDPANRAALEQCVAKRVPDHPNVAIYDFALADEQGEASFHDGLGYASQLSATGRLRVRTQPLDALALAPSFVKLHVEGGELAALQGARETLLEYRPIIATTIYHNADGIWRTPLWLMETLPDYRFLLRNHSWCGTGSVVYAIPRERRA